MSFTSFSSGVEYRDWLSLLKMTVVLVRLNFRLLKLLGMARFRRFNL